MPVLSQKRCVLLSLLLPLSILPVLFYFGEDANRVYLRYTSSVIETHVNETDRMTLDSDRRELIDVLRVPYIYLLRLCYLSSIEPTNSNYCYVPTGVVVSPPVFVSMCGAFMQIYKTLPVAT